MVRDMTPNRAAAGSGGGSGLFHRHRSGRLAGARGSDLPFREAHHVTGALVALAERKGCDLPDLSLAEMQAVHPAINQSVYSVLGVHNSVASRQAMAAPRPTRCARRSRTGKQVLK